MANLFIRTNKYILQTEVMRIVGINEETDRKMSGRDSEDRDNRRKDRERRNDSTAKLQYKNSTLLSDSRSHILVAIERTNLLKFPKKVDRPMGKDRDAYCRFHRTYGHYTDSCRELMNQIESLIRKGQLKVMFK